MEDNAMKTTPRFPHWAQRFLLGLAILLTQAGHASAGVIFAQPEFFTRSAADFFFDFKSYSGFSTLDSVTAASSQALAGNTQTPETRTAARVGGNEIAVNARGDGKNLDVPTKIIDDDSEAQFSAVLTNLGPTAQDIQLNFYIPPSYVETTTPEDEITASIAAFMYFERCTICSPTLLAFGFLASLDNTFNDVKIGDSVVGAPPGLDTRPLLLPFFSDVTTSTNGVLYRTVHMGFPAFGGTVDLGSLDPGESLKFSYDMEAVVTGTMARNVGIASINDPFFFDTDPVSPGPAISIIAGEPTPNATPEPATFWLIGGALVGLGLRLRSAGVRRRVGKK
jgi:hypothetical protein